MYNEIEPRQWHCVFNKNSKGKDDKDYLTQIPINQISNFFKGLKHMN